MIPESNEASNRASSIMTNKEKEENNTNSREYVNFTDLFNLTYCVN